VAPVFSFPSVKYQIIVKHMQTSGNGCRAVHKAPADGQTQDVPAYLRYHPALLADLADTAGVALAPPLLALLEVRLPSAVR
jgi:hypothetical protein